MTAHLTHIWIGVALVGLWLMIMVIREGQAKIYGLIRQREAMRQAIFELQSGIDVEEDKVEELSVCVKELQKELATLEEETRHLTQAIKGVHQKLNRVPQTLYKERT